MSHRFPSVANLFLTPNNTVMKKIVIAFDNTSFSRTAIDFAVKINELSPILLPGVFLPKSIIATVWSFAETVPTDYFVPAMEPENAVDVMAHVKSFETICEQHGIDYRVHKDFYDLSIPELIRESRRDLEILRLGFDAKKYFNTWLVEKPASVLVTGAYGRSDLSRMFKGSFINDVITDQKVPIFIAHR